MFLAAIRRTEGLFHRHRRVTQLSTILGKEKKIFKRFIDDIEQDPLFFGYIKDKMQHHLRYTPSKYDFMYTSKTGSIFFPCVTLYSLMRALEPEIVVETGGTPGKSSAAILKALSENNKGHLYTLDLPPQTTAATLNPSDIHCLRPESDVSCWAIEPALRSRHTLLFGDTKATLIPLFRQLKEVDVFIHDSDHSYEHMMFEFKASWDFIKKGGLLISDDVSTNASFSDFAKMMNREAYYIANYGFLIK